MSQPLYCCCCYY